MNNRGEVQWYLIGLVLAIIVLAVFAVKFITTTNQTNSITQGTSNSLVEQYKNINLNELTPDLQTQLNNQGAEGKAVVLLAKAKDYYTKGKDASYSLDARKDFLQQALQEVNLALATLNLDEKAPDYQDQPSVILLHEIQATINTLLATEQMANLQSDEDYQTFIQERAHTIIGSVAQANYLYKKFLEQKTFATIEAYEQANEQQPNKHKAFGYYALAYFYKHLAEQPPPGIADQKTAFYQEAKDYTTRLRTLTADSLLQANARLLHANILFQEKNYEQALTSYETLLKDYSYQKTQGSLETKERSIMENNIKTMNPSLYTTLVIDISMTGTIEDNDGNIINLPTPITPRDQSTLRAYARSNYPAAGEKITFVLDKQALAQTLKVDEVHGLEPTSELRFSLTIKEGLFNLPLCTVTTRLIPTSTKQKPNLGWPILWYALGNSGGHADKGGSSFPRILPAEEQSILGNCESNGHIYATLSSYALDTTYSDSEQDTITLLLTLPDWKKTSP